MFVFGIKSCDCAIVPEPLVRVLRFYRSAPFVRPLSSSSSSSSPLLLSSLLSAPVLSSPLLCFRPMYCPGLPSLWCPVYFHSRRLCFSLLYGTWHSAAGAWFTSIAALALPFCIVPGIHALVSGLLPWPPFFYSSVWYLAFPSSAWFTSMTAFVFLFCMVLASPLWCLVYFHSHLCFFPSVWYLHPSPSGAWFTSLAAFAFSLFYCTWHLPSSAWPASMAVLPLLPSASDKYLTRFGFSETGSFIFSLCFGLIRVWCGTATPFFAF